MRLFFGLFSCEVTQTQKNKHGIQGAGWRTEEEKRRKKESEKNISLNKKKSRYSTADILTGQFNLNNTVLRHRSQVIVGSVKLKTKINHLTK